MARLRTTHGVVDLTVDNTRMTQAAKDYAAKYVSYNQQILNDVVMVYGDNPAIASAISGTSDIHSLEYKRVIRSVQKLRKGQIKNVDRSKYSRAMVDLLHANGQLPSEEYIQAAHKQGAVFVSFSGTVTISQITEYRTMHATVPLAELVEASLESNLAGYNVVARYGDYPAIAQVYSDVTIRIS